MEIKLIWDRKKSLQNLEKHKVSFEEARECFYDPRALVIADTLHSVGEDRFILVGMNSSFGILVVVHVYKECDEIIRIISARRATRSEMDQYYKR